ncbi:hypothetical protein JCM6882_004293 [Rhodosporidiobolus microsporus]
MAPTRTRDDGSDNDDDHDTTPFRKDFNDKVYACVRRIPEGKVCSYGQIAKLIGHPRHSRLVGTALKVLPRSLASPYILPPPPLAASTATSSAATSRATSNASSSRPPSNIGDVESAVNSPMPLPSSFVEVPDLNVDDLLFPPVASTSTSFLAPPAPTSEGAPAAAAAADAGADDAGDAGDGEEEEDDVLPAPLPNPSVVPWWRVVSQTGVISPRGSSHAVERQADFLRAEGVVVRDGPRNGGGGGAGEGGGAAGVDAFGLGGAVAGGRVSMAKFSWKGP